MTIFPACVAGFSDLSSICQIGDSQIFFLFKKSFSMTYAIPAQIGVFQWCLRSRILVIEWGKRQNEIYAMNRSVTFNKTFLIHLVFYLFYENGVVGNVHDAKGVCVSNLLILKEGRCPRCRPVFFVRLVLSRIKWCDKKGKSIVFNRSLDKKGKPIPYN